MTMPDERYRAVMWAREFLEDICNSSRVKDTQNLRSEATRILRHFPNQYDMANAAQLAPIVFQKEIEPLYRMVKRYEQEKMASVMPDLKMKLILDDYNQIYVWVDDQDENRELSPHFDYEEDAVQWYDRISKHMVNKHVTLKD